MRKCVYCIILFFFVFSIHITLVPALEAAIRIMPLGDSITQGASSGVTDEDFQVSYRLDLWDKLRNAGYDVDFVGSLNSGSSMEDFDADHEGHPGWMPCFVYEFEIAH